MACGKCEEAWATDGHAPDCATDKGCVIPPLSDTGAHVMALREKLIMLKGLISAEVVLTLYGATGEDVEMLARVEELLRQEHGAHRKGVTPWLKSK